MSIIENVPAEESLTGRPMRLAAMNPAEVEWWRTNATSFEEFAVSMPETQLRGSVPAGAAQDLRNGPGATREAVLAVYVPARRATRVDPLVVP